MKQLPSIFEAAEIARCRQWGPKKDYERIKRGQYGRAKARMSREDFEALTAMYRREGIEPWKRKKKATAGLRYNRVSRRKVTLPKLSGAV